MHDSLELLVKVLAEVTSILVALGVVIAKLSELEAQIRVNREHIRLQSGLLSDLTAELSGFVRSRPDERGDAEARSHV